MRAGHARARAETVGSLLRPERLLAARRDRAGGAAGDEQLRELEDAAVLEAIQGKRADGNGAVRHQRHYFP